MSDYTLGIKELDSSIGGIKKGSNIMLIGPPMSGKEILLYSIMYWGAAKNDNAVITVTTRESATHILEWFKEQKLVLPMSRVGIVDCVTKTLGGASVENENIKIEIEKERAKNIGPLQKTQIFAVKDKILEIIKGAEDEGGIEVDRIIMNLRDAPSDIINQEIKKLLEEGIIFEPRPGKIRWLG